jgi:hypothetical protein
MSGEFYKDLLNSRYEQEFNKCKSEMKKYIKDFKSGIIQMSKETLHKYWVYSEYLERNKK